jgi:hypothetical protein
MVGFTRPDGCHPHTQEHHHRGLRGNFDRDTDAQDGQILRQFHWVPEDKAKDPEENKPYDRQHGSIEYKGMHDQGIKNPSP